MDVISTTFRHPSITDLHAELSNASLSGCQRSPYCFHPCSVLGMFPLEDNIFQQSALVSDVLDRPFASRSKNQPAPAPEMKCSHAAQSHTTHHNSQLLALASKKNRQLTLSFFLPACSTTDSLGVSFYVFPWLQGPETDSKTDEMRWDGSQRVAVYEDK